MFQSGQRKQNILNGRQSGIYIFRVFMAEKARLLSAMSDAKSNASRVYAILRQRIIRCDIGPEQKLKIAELATELDVSPGAVREALSRLSTECLVTATDQRGFRAATINVAMLEDLTDTRIVIETLMLSRAISRADDAARAKIRSAERAMFSYRGAQSSDKAVRLHGQFHEALVASCGSPTLSRIRSSLYEVSQRYRYFAMRTGNLERDVVDEHGRIAAAAIAGDIAWACAEMSDHIRRTSEIVKAALGGYSDSKTDGSLSYALTLPASL